jgi:hypothetical protein
MNTTPPIDNHLRRAIACSVLILSCLIGLAGCGNFAAAHKDRPFPAAPDSTEPAVRELSPAQDYAGEILAYFLQVVVGHIGPEERRQAWRSAGSDAALDFDTISQIMTQPAWSKSDLMVLDFNLLGLVEVLSHYNPQFNLFKGRYIFDSVYPSSELIALRLLIQRKLSQDEKVNFTALHNREAMLRPHADAPTPADLAKMKLSAGEFQLLKDVFTSDPLFFQYYKHPFIVDAMTQIGFYQPDRLTAEISRNASYKQYAPRWDYRKNSSKSVNVVILPSFTGEFAFGGQYESPYVYGFKPSADFVQAIEKLEADILERSAHFLFTELKNGGEAGAADYTLWRRQWDDTYAPLIQFNLFDQRPLTIYPENADRLVKEICPTADLVILILGDGIDRIIYAEEDADDFAAAGELYFSRDDISYFRKNGKIDKIARGIVGRLMSIRVSAGNPVASG